MKICKRVTSLLLVLALMLALIPSVYAADNYTGKTVVLYTANVRGDVDVYAQIAAVKADYEAKGAQVLLLDAGNYLQGTAAANTDRGLSVYALMEAAGYDAAAMGPYDFVYGDATTGYLWHGNFYKYYTQAELLQGCEELTYAKNGKGDVTETRPAKAPAEFQVLCSNYAIADNNSGYYAFSANHVFHLDNGLKIGVVALTDPDTADDLQDGFLSGYEVCPVQTPEDTDVLVRLINDPGAESCDGAVDIVAGEKFTTGAYVIDNATKAVTEEEVTLDGKDEAVAALADTVKANADTVVGVSEVILDGRDSAGRTRETNLGDLVTDALKWYAENKFEGFDKDVPVVAIQNGGNCDNSIYDGQITQTDLLRALPFSPMGVGILYLKGSQLLEALEAGTSPSDDYGDACPGFAQVSGLTYTVAAYAPYDRGEAYGKFYQANSIKRVTITSVGGEAFDPDATYAVIADNYLMNGNDTYYVFKNAKSAEGAKYLNNGNGVKTRDIVQMYMKEDLGGVVGQRYAQAQNRITVLSQQPYENPYKDVKESDWFYEYVKYTTQNGLFVGNPDGTFCPQEKMTRAMIVMTLYRLAGEPEASGYDNPFRDVPDGQWYTDAVCWAANNGIVLGTSATEFEPNSNVTREQTAAIFYRYVKHTGGDLSAKAPLDAYPDAGKVSDWAQDALQWAVAVGLVTGSNESGVNYLLPAGNTTRAEAATMLTRYHQMVK